LWERRPRLAPAILLHVTGGLAAGEGSSVTGTSLGVDSIAEFQTLTGTYGAQFGGNDVCANQNVHQWFNPACFTASTYGTVGNLGRNALIGPGYWDTDVGIMKNTKINERLRIQFRAELFNIFNHANFSFPGMGVFTAGSITSHYQAIPVATAGPDHLACGRRRFN
jgi:hypothetical protein